MAKKLPAILLLVVIVAGGLWWKRSEDKKSSDRALAQAMLVVSDAEGFEANRAYFTKLVESAHPRAFDLAIQSGRRKRSGRLDDDLYESKLIEAMREQAQRENRMDIDEFLADLQRRLDAS